MIGKEAAASRAAESQLSACGTHVPWLPPPQSPPHLAKQVGGVVAREEAGSNAQPVEDERGMEETAVDEEARGLGPVDLRAAVRLLPEVDLLHQVGRGFEREKLYVTNTILTSHLR